MSGSISPEQESSFYQATLGKRAAGIIVTDLHGNPIPIGKATGRYFGKFISTVILFLGYLMAAFTKKKQALHDIMAGCLVLNKAKSSTWFDRAVKELIEIFRLHPESFVPGEGGHPEERIQIISRMLKERGGLRMMEKAYSRILRECELMEEKLLRQRIKNYLDSSGLMWDSQPITPETGNRSQEYLSDKS